ncbi:MAG TPA: glutamine-hydrolyzing GMP synthase [bacterium]|nr:glutamine-hydrolyzing GMP synthase [bacterium]
MDKVLILDFGSQYNQLIARRIREMNVYCELHTFDVTIDFIKEFAPVGIIFSGGPNSVNDEGSPDVSPEIFNLGIPILGICYGMQLMSVRLGGRLESGDSREYGRAMVENLAPKSPLFRNVSDSTQVWMSHSDHVSVLPSGFYPIAKTNSIPYAAIGNDETKMYAVQFHPEVIHTVEGGRILSNFLFEVCNASAEWKMENYIATAVEKLHDQIKDKKVVLGLSGSRFISNRRTSCQSDRKEPHCNIC